MKITSLTLSVLITVGCSGGPLLSESGEDKRDADPNRLLDGSVADSTQSDQSEIPEDGDGEIVGEIIDIAGAYLAFPDLRPVSRVFNIAESDGSPVKIDLIPNILNDQRMYAIMVSCESPGHFMIKRGGYQSYGEYVMVEEMPDHGPAWVQLVASSATTFKGAAQVERIFVRWQITNKSDGTKAQLCMAMSGSGLVDSAAGRIIRRQEFSATKLTAKLKRKSDFALSEIFFNFENGVSETMSLLGPGDMATLETVSGEGSLTGIGVRDEAGNEYSSSALDQVTLFPATGPGDPCFAIDAIR